MNPADVSSVSVAHVTVETLVDVSTVTLAYVPIVHPTDVSNRRQCADCNVLYTPEQEYETFGPGSTVAK